MNPPFRLNLNSLTKLNLNRLTKITDVKIDRSCHDPLYKLNLSKR